MAKKKKTFLTFTKLLHLINSIFATALFLSYFLPFISPKNTPTFSVLSLFVPVLIILNIAFFIYWIIKLKKYFILSGLVLLIGWSFSTPFYKISSKKTMLETDVKVMSYNVRMMNYYKWIKEDSIDAKIVNFINEKKPDILAFQEYHYSKKRNLKYPYSYFAPKSKKKNFGLAIFTNYKIINKGSLDFKQSSNNAIFVDIVKQKDTIRIYNLHLQSLKINPAKENFGQENSEKLLARLKSGFKKQTLQTEQFLKHEQQFKGKKIICGDLNNTSYSWVYKQIAKNKKDAFIEAGSGLGKSFNYFFPMRIDFIFTDSKTSINYFKTYDKKYSDHYPIFARINFNE